MPRLLDPVEISIGGLRKSFGPLVILEDLSLHIPGGDICCLLGPSGCGKTTLLRLIAGLEKVDRGTIRIGGVEVTHLAPHHRELGMVFQNYALFPHMTVAENVAFGLRLRKVPPPERQARVASAMTMVKLDKMGDRLPSQLSGGQRQRVALARSLITQPKVLLLDEPLSALDKKLRGQMQVEIKDLQRNVGVTTVVVTHDQEEALAIADRIVVMDGGRILQIGRPREVYDKPGSPFVADFIGASNTIEAKVMARAREMATVSSPLGILKVPAPHGASIGSDCLLSIRPENINILSGAGAETARWRGQVRHIVYKGNLTEYVVALDNGVELKAVRPNRAAEDQQEIALEQNVSLSWSDHSVILHAQGPTPDIGLRG
ncbi:ABC transporter ATP-binding protein [Mesorhizobium sp.]|uniref:ABC transporter ATP-binding protein n=1 Tax=Mesorhizobium sp. TaxID=1871066 RepID=UPI000FE9141D|nr:ABC transporter ATP-binding protein [Mesorhizobium sp.]RWJ05725.1 MAG: ABC transporter ATP-binding protein [Mesorhizobium sp.]